MLFLSSLSDPLSLHISENHHFLTYHVTLVFLLLEDWLPHLLLLLSFKRPRVILNIAMTLFDLLYSFFLLFLSHFYQALRRLLI